MHETIYVYITFKACYLFEINILNHHTLLLLQVRLFRKFRVLVEHARGLPRGQEVGRRGDRGYYPPPPRRSARDR